MDYTEDMNTEPVEMAPEGDFTEPNVESGGPDGAGEPPKKKKHSFAKGLVTGILGTVVVLTITVGGVVYYGYRQLVNRTEAYEKQKNQSGESPLELDRIADKLYLIDSLVRTAFLYQENIDTELQEKYVYYGYLASLGDPYAMYYNARDYVKLMEKTNGYVGIGATVQRNAKTGCVEVVSLVPNGPAEKGGLLPGDIFYKVDDEDVYGKDTDLLISENIRGVEGTALTITVYRSSVDDYVSLPMTREKIVSETVSSSQMGEIGLIRIAQFDESTPDQFKNALETLSGQGAKKFVIDLRNNPGGSDTSVTACMDYILPDGKLMLKFEGLGDQKKEFVTNDGHEMNAPMAILVNGNSASAAEVFSGTMQDYGRAKLIGTKTYGKGVVQSIIPLADGSAVKFTTQRYFTPNGRSIDEIGLTPDVECELAEGLTAGTSIPVEKDNQLQKAIEILNETSNE